MINTYVNFVQEIRGICWLKELITKLIVRSAIGIITRFDAPSRTRIGENASFIFYCIPAVSKEGRY